MLNLNTNIVVPTRNASEPNISNKRQRLSDLKD